MLAGISLFSSGKNQTVIIIFFDTDEHVNRVLPTLKEKAAHRLIVRENVMLEQGNLDLRAEPTSAPAPHRSLQSSYPCGTSCNRGRSARPLR